MASPLPSQLREATTCLECGDKGYPERLIYCMTCQNWAIHEYCLNNYSPADGDIKWWCWDCRGEDISKAEPLRKSERIIDKRQKSLKMRNHLKQKLKAKRRLVQISNNIHEAGQLANDGHLPIKGLETNLVNDRQRDLDILEKEKSILEIASNSEHNEQLAIDVHLPIKGLETNLVNDRQIGLDILEKEKSIPEIASNSEHNESITNEPTCATNSNLPDKEEHNVKSFDEAQEIPEFGNSEKVFLLKDSDNAQNDGKDVALQVPVYVANHSSPSHTLCMQPYLEPDDSLSSNPIIDPIWRGWLNIKEKSEICVEILAHLSTKACLKASDAAAALPTMLDVILLDKLETWPNSFRAAPPTASSIGIYFFPACERNERVYDSLLDVVIERELSLKVILDNVELLIFPSSELPLQQWRFKGKYFLWGVFKEMQNCSSTLPSTSMQLKLTEPTVTGNKEDLVRSQHADHPSTQIQPYESPVSTKSSQASNVALPMQTTPESLPIFGAHE